jgi:hypothetical protein
MPTSGYHLDLSAFSLEKLKYLFKNTRLLPSQQILQENIDERFASLEQNDVDNLQQLQKALKTKSDVQSFAKVTGLPLDYLTILRREVNSYQPKPINLKDFPGVNPEVIQKLGQIGIKNTKQLFANVLTQKERSEFAKQTQIEYEDILELTKLTDVARMKWVGPKFARLLIESEYDTVEKVANSNYEELYQALVRTNEESGVYKVKFGIEDLKSWVDVVVQDVPQVIRY